VDLAEHSTLRRELRAWLEEHLTDDVRAALTAEDIDARWSAQRRWNAALVDAGYGAVGWPPEHGGRGAGVQEQLVVLEEMARARAPGPVNAIGVSNIAPAIMGYGTGAQRQRHLRPMLRGDEIWCQGMSEPDAGSDLASLVCRAARDGDHFVVSGQKTWSSNGDRADWCQLYVRTDAAAPKHQGITCLLVDMRTAGIDVRPIRTMAGDAGFADVFFDGARVPVDAVLGQEGGGWAVATRTLSHERAGVASLHLNLRRKLDDLLADSAPPHDPVARDRLAQRHVDATVLELLGRRTLDAAAAGRPPGPEGSVVKLAWSRHEQALAETAVDVLGLLALGGERARALLASRSFSIAGGTSEVNKNLIGERVLGLPK